MKRKILIYSIIFFVVFLNTDAVYGQEQPSRRQRAEQYFDRLEFAKAAAAYERLVDVSRPRVVDMERLAYSYLYIKEYDLAENWYARVVSEEGRSEEHTSELQSRENL